MRCRYWSPLDRPDLCAMCDRPRDAHDVQGCATCGGAGVVPDPRSPGWRVDAVEPWQQPHRACPGECRGAGTVPL